MVSFPTSLDSLTNPTLTDDLDTAGVEHDVQHSDLNDIAEALEAKVGVDSSAVVTSLDYRTRGLEGPVPFTPSGVDDLFDDESFSGWTAVNSGSHTVTVTERNRRCSLLLPGGDSAAELHAWMKSHTFSTSDWIEAAFDGWGRDQNYNIAGLIFADGTTYGAGRQAVFYISPQEQSVATAEFTNYNSGSVSGYGMQHQARGGSGYIRLKWDGSGVIHGYASPDGISWVDIATRTINGGSFSPTKVGFFVTTWGGGSPYAWSLRYFRQGNG